ncbi:phosphatase PAP2 family protein [Croceicoccus gelatinilyticus]|uniref:phosphatase PAP2 family protein n=1 Tax=Croceicoccus gelatinilyticus TaxID=2835536 RepID=UPI001BCC8281|nr:phosphatase PAP2 family protein [Croceicoccus gelatinilyticus]MBS7670730.1 phosphatase PAP2 family protein [Croceicoccus gelatinilyticus]
MGERMLSFTRRLSTHFRKTDAALLLVSAFALFCSSLAYYLDGRQILQLPTLEREQVLLMTLPFSLWLASIVALMMRRGYERPLRIVLRLLRRDPFWLVRAAALLLIISGTARAYTAFKLQIPQIQPFYADPIIANIEATLFGQDPWRLTHAVFGVQGTVVLDRIYVIWFPVSAFLVTWATMTRDRVFQARAVAAMFFVWFVLGNFVALAFSSAGPVYYEHFYGDDRFAPLIETLRAYHEQVNVRAIVLSDWLISDEDAGKLGKGISAMPSVHVGMTFVTWLLVQSRLGWKNPVSAIVAIYVAAIWVGSVHLAWHYWLDGAVSIAATALFWKATGLWLKPKAAPSQSAQPAPRAARPETPDLPEGVQAGQAAQ